MDHRLKKIQRVLEVREKMHELAEWKLAALDREKAELNAGQQELLGALNREDGLHGLFVEAMARRLTVLARETERVNQARAAQLGRLFEEALALKRSERMTTKVRKEYLRDLWKRGFDDLLEALMKRDGASFQ